MNTQWQPILDILKEDLDPGTFNVWINPLEAETKGKKLCLYAQAPYMADWIKEHLLQKIEAIAKKEIDKDVQVSIGVKQKKAEHKAPERKSSENTQLVQPWMPGITIQQPRPKQWRYAFKDLVIGESNQMAVAAAQDVCRSDGFVQTLYVNASAGLGKTHIAQAVGHTICDNSEKRVDYLTAEEFSSRYVASLKTREVESFKDSLRNLDVLLFEDVHFLQNKPKIQETVLSVVKNIQDRGGRVVFTSSFSPKELQKVDSQLVSSFCSGILTSIGRPDHEMRYEIIKRKAESKQIE
ncbi:MAG: ATP-binding protein, partial [Desulfovibrio sp.]|nr:ATP-binding protein [Desulfovibrio sp.]